MRLISAARDVLRYFDPGRQRRNFSEDLYLRYSPDLNIGLARAGIRSGLEHYARHGALEGRARTYRRLEPGQSVDFEMSLAHGALTGFELFIGNEKAGPADYFDLSINDRGRTVFRERFTHGIIALDRRTYFPTGLLEGLSARVQVQLSNLTSAKNAIWLMTRARPDDGTPSFEGVAFFDDPHRTRLDPIGINLSPVSQCNQNCPHCISKFSRKTFNKISDKALDEIRALALNGKIHHISIDYSGDPFFTNARYFPLFDFIEELGCQFRIDTNGAYVDEESMRRLALGHLYGINFSLDAATGPTHKRVRPGNVAFEKIIDNIKVAMRVLRECGRSDVLTSANFSIMKSNAHEVLEFVDLCCDLGLKSVNFSHVHVYQRETELESLADTPDVYNDIYDDLISKLLLSGLVFSVPPRYSPGLETHGRSRCSAPWESAVILSNGDVQACCVPGTKIGNLHEKSFEEIWASDEAAAFRRQAVATRSTICGRCAFYKHRGRSEAD